MTYGMIETQFTPVQNLRVGDVIQTPRYDGTVMDFWYVYMKRQGEALDTRECNLIIRVQYRDTKGKVQWQDYQPEAGVYKILS